ncbi:glycosyltransferase family 4 protein [candidate division KSB1 bacterium]|nr:glycosyltransferase family 4 protein [candidate division KSB1 bacterium]
MKIVHIIPGSGTTFYCQNCMRDNTLVEALRDLGHDVSIVPMYLPLNIDDPHSKLYGDTPVFYGAINTYLKQVLPIYRKAPVWVERLFDSRFLLNIAAHKAGSTSAVGLEDMTISMLKGEEGNQSTELEHLVHWLKEHSRPDIIHLSNALLLGLAGKIKKELGTPIVCSLQDENQWIDPMEPEYQERVWHLMAEKAADVASFTPVSNYYAKVMREKMSVSETKIDTVHIGIDLSVFVQNDLSFDPPVIGFLSRMNRSQGLDILVDAFLILKRQERFNNLKLYITGGYTADDGEFIKHIQGRLKESNVYADVRIFHEFDQNHRKEFLKSISVLSVPVPAGEAFGTYLLEAFATGIPVVQPDVGAFPEIIEKTGGGVIYKRNTPENLADALETLLLNPDRARKYGESGAKSVHDFFSIQKMAADMVNVYEKILSNNLKPGK